MSISLFYMARFPIYSWKSLINVLDCQLFVRWLDRGYWNGICFFFRTINHLLDAWRASADSLPIPSRFDIWPEWLGPAGLSLPKLLESWFTVCLVSRYSEKGKFGIDRKIIIIGSSHNKLRIINASCRRNWNKWTKYIIKRINMACSPKKTYSGCFWTNRRFLHLQIINIWMTW